MLALLGLRCCVWACAACGEQGLLFLAVCRLLIVVPSLVATATEPTCHNHFLAVCRLLIVVPSLVATATEPMCHNHWSSHTLVPVLRNRHTTFFYYSNSLITPIISDFFPSRIPRDAIVFTIHLIVSFNYGRVVILVLFFTFLKRWWDFGNGIISCTQ